jgi:hypothetical protein
VGDPSLPFVEIESGGFFEVSTAKSFDLIHGAIFSNAFFHIKTDEAITLGRLVVKGQKSFTSLRGNHIGPEVKITHDDHKGNGSCFISNEGIRLETKDYTSYGGEILVMDKDLELLTTGNCYPVGDLIEVWKGNAKVTANFFCQHRYNVIRKGDDICAPYWVDYALPGTEPSRLCVNGNIYFNVNKGESWSSSILASGMIVGQEMIKPMAYHFYFQSAIPYSLQTLYYILHPARCTALSRRGWSNDNMVKMTQEGSIDYYFTGTPPIEPENHISYTPLTHIEGAQGIAFTKTRQARVHGRMVGSKLLLGFEDDLIVQTVGTPGPVIPYQPLMDLGALCAPSRLVQVDTTGKASSLLVPTVPLRYPLDQELQGRERLILGPRGSEKLRFALPSFLEGRALLEAFQQNIGYVPLTPECPDYLSLHLQLRQNGADVMKILRPFLETPELLGLPSLASSDALISASQGLLQGLPLADTQALAQKLKYPLIFYTPHLVNDERVLRPHLYTPFSYDNPERRACIAQLWAKELYLLGKPGSHLHLDKSRLVADQGKIVTGLLSLEEEIAHDGDHYLPCLGKTIEGDTWEIHADNVISKLGSIDVKHLWLDVLNQYYSSGVTKANTLVMDVKHVTLDREQREWTVTYTVETTTKTKNSFGHSKKKSHSESHTVILKESYPAHLSGLLAFEKFISAQEDATALFPERKEGREMESLRIYGGGVKTGPEGWRHKVKGEIEVRSKEETSLAPFAIRYKGHSKQGMQLVHSPQQPFIEVPQKDLSLTAQMIHLEGAVLKVPQGKVLLEALQELWIESAKVIEHLAPSYYQAKGKIHEVGGWQEKFSSSLIEALGVTLKAPKIKGHYPQASCSIQYDTLSNTLTHPISQQELYDIVVGQVSKGNAGFAMVAALAVGLASMGTATPAVMAAFFGELGGTIASAMVASITSQTASSLVMHQGNLKQVGRDLTSKGMLVTLVTSGGSSGPSLTLVQQAKAQLIKAGMRGALNVAILGEKPKDALKEAVKYAAVSTVAAQVAWEIGQASQGENPRLNYAGHKLAHFGNGLVAGLVLSKGDIKKAIAAGTAASLSEVIAEGLPPSLSREARGNIAKIGTGLIAVMAQQDVCLAIFTACNAIDNNFLSQEDNLLQKKKQEEEELAQVLEYLSPANRAKAGFMRELIAEEQQSNASSPAVGKMTRRVADYSRQCKDYLRDFSEEYPRVTALGLKGLKAVGIGGEALLVIGGCAGPQSPFLCWGALGLVAATHSGLTGKAFDQLNQGVAWGLEQGGARPYDAQEVAPWLSGGALVMAGSAKAVNFGLLNKQLSLRIPASPLSLEVGSRFPYQAKAYLREMEQITSRPLHAEQRMLLKKVMQEEKYMKLSQEEYKIHRDLFDQNKNKLVSQWETKTGQIWPTYEASLLSKEGRIIKKVGNKYDAHEIIPNEYGGPLTWYNIHPARFPDQHQAGIHGKGSSLNQLLKNLGSSQ